jgi:hypothetical protein
MSFVRAENTPPKQWLLEHVGHEKRYWESYNGRGTAHRFLTCSCGDLYSLGGYPDSRPDPARFYIARVKITEAIIRWTGVVLLAEVMVAIVYLLTKGV